METSDARKRHAEQRLDKVAAELGMESTAMYVRRLCRDLLAAHARIAELEKELQELSE